MGLQAFTKTDRMLKRADFVQLSKTGHKIHNRHFTVLFRTGAGDQTRLGVTVTKKVGNAVIRNRIKRLSREMFRKNRQKMTGVRELNIIAKKAAAELPTQQYFFSLGSIFDSISRKYSSK